MPHMPLRATPHDRTPMPAFSSGHYLTAPLAAALGGAMLLAAGSAAGTDTYPQHPIHIVVPNGPGGSIDQVVRAVSERMAATLGEPFVIDNREGASGTIGALAVKAAAPDGYVLLASSTSTNTLTPHVQAHAGFNGVQDFTSIVNLAYTTKLVVVSATVPAHTLAELVDYARKHPGELNYGSTGIGSSAQLDAEMFCDLAGIHLTHIPYRNVNQAALALGANDVQVSLSSITALIAQIKSGRARALAVIADQRSPLLPDVPTVAEAGMPKLAIHTWIGLSAPAGTPAPIVERLNAAANHALAEPDLRKWMEEQGWEVVGGTSASFARTVAADDAKWAAQIRKLGLTE
jgi:tripartite-type tricarboxylate transporter receptor subunit TctC